jgi:exodeoxyribonuclease-3
MRIVTWNCKMGLHKKVDALLALNPDVAVVPECTWKSVMTFREHGYETAWFGVDPIKKGLGILCRKGWTIQALQQPVHKWIVPLDIGAPVPFRLIAVWACRSEIQGVTHYIGQVHHALLSQPDWFDGKPVVLAGDLNSNKIWDKERRVGNHSDVVKMLEQRGLVSAYHQFHVEEQGVESLPTIYLHHHQDRPYHIDYIFVPREWVSALRNVEVGLFEQWSKLSDHCPVTVELVEPKPTTSP